LADGTETIVSESREATLRAGEALGRRLGAGDVVALTGELGSGKTVFIQGACAGLGVREPVTSPTFTLMQEYRGRLPVYHFDFYRLESVREIADLDPAAAFEAGGVCFIEWAERGRPLLPDGRIEVELSHVVENGRPVPDRRRILIRTAGERGRRPPADGSA
jgi:tRNA threonylcarbamoyladenosine biosynthesis protein TsaE